MKSLDKTKSVLLEIDTAIESVTAEELNEIRKGIDIIKKTIDDVEKHSQQTDKSIWTPREKNC